MYTHARTSIHTNTRTCYDISQALKVLLLGSVGKAKRYTVVKDLQSVGKDKEFGPHLMKCVEEVNYANTMAIPDMKNILDSIKR